MRTTLIALLLAASAAATAQSYPTKPVRIIVSYPPGGGLDLMTRMVALKLHEAFGQTFVVENRSGASGTIGAAAVAKSDPDGYTLLAAGNPEITLMPHVADKLPYNALADLVPLVQVATAASVLVAHPSLGATTLKDVIDMARASPGRLSYGTPGAGTPTHFAMEVLKAGARVDIVHVPYKGGGPAVQDVLAGQVPLAVINAPPLMPHIRSGRLRAIAVMGAKRSTLLPDVPTVGEAVGIDRATSSAWFAFFAPAGTPAEIRSRLETAIVKSLDEPGLRTRLVDSGMELSALTGEPFASLIREESAMHAELLKRFASKPQ